ncbi:MAG: M23 family metallopeptidase [Chloroflexota bacterium]|nr:MAG: M23 family metallopeptidase [Chloroflexota bacterium]
MCEPFYLAFPLNCAPRLTDPFDAPRPYANGKHEGADFAALLPDGTPATVLAAQRGYVARVGYQRDGYGLFVRIVHLWQADQTFVTWYGHLSRVWVREGQSVALGQPLGIAGSSGFSSGVHLHLTLQHLGHGLSGYSVRDVVNPLLYLRLP